ncbi:YceI family protein [Flagellimonas halotolerans]|uniref:YceI family protein n=1 Tax=Flagellimonas halotolerans TaxID=3112164 RepID=A0ABU6IT54_9FLAO|nr:MULTISPECIES: YceI family protein [unclassified Allomuricauda]MEC3966456.1 YceI family protein [Muricauda sp. SYSU M86414]MEC4266321.1 YceI family protein [Muricauda sp. SYSU M84420]
MFFISWFNFNDPERETKVRVEPESEVVIAGTTNVNNFTCKYNLQELEMPIRLIYDEKSEQILFKNAELTLINDCFDCGGKAINRDFQELLKTERHPQVGLKLLYVEPPSPNQSMVDVGVEIKIAGVSRKYQTLLNCEQAKDICVNGTLELKLSDFDLEPPKKMLGMIKVDDEIKVHLTLQLSEI